MGLLEQGEFSWAFRVVTKFPDADVSRFQTQIVHRKTESVKALGAALGRFCLVFNCDESFDFSAVGRILSGLSQVGAWGCFDEFNRLEERILSAVSQQILTIQRGLIERKDEVELLGRSIKLHENVGIFITMNPGYEGRSNLPDNLKNLFRSFAMVVPDRKLIAQVMLYSQGIVTAEGLAGRVVDLFLKCKARMSDQLHYVSANIQCAFQEIFLRSSNFCLFRISDFVP